MKLILANPRGFCAGVYMAIDVVDELLDICEGETLYVHHEIVHNRHVVDRFRARGWSSPTTSRTFPSERSSSSALTA